MAQLLQGLGQLEDRYKAVLCDVWGVVHNGVDVYRQADDALTQFRAAGGRVVLITNSPRRHIGVEQQLGEMGVSPAMRDAVVTSGDVTRTLIQRGPEQVFHLGPERDQPLFAGLDRTMVPLEEAETIVCTGLFEDEMETPDDYAAMLAIARERSLPFICANPDIVVERGERMIWCAGALARAYQAIGGLVHVAGKPHAPIYKLAMETLADISSAPIAAEDILCIGDGLPTDVKGANDKGLDLLYTSAGIHAGEYGDTEQPDEGRLHRFLADNGAHAAFWMPRLVW